MENNSPSKIRRVLLEYLSGNHAHAGFQKAVEGLSLDDVGATLESIPHTIWELAEHIRIAQRDILEFSRDPDYESPPWPSGYWPANSKPPDLETWQQTVEAVHADRRAMMELIQKESADLLEPFPYGEGQTLLREALLIIEHNAYHIGQIIQIRRLLGIWPMS